MWTASVFCFIFLAAQQGFCRPGKSAYDSFPKMIEDGIYAPSYNQYRIPLNHQPSPSELPLEFENLVETDNDYDFLVPPSKNYKTIREEQLSKQEQSLKQLMNRLASMSTAIRYAANFDDEAYKIQRTATSAELKNDDASALSVTTPFSEELAEDERGIRIRIISINGRPIGLNNHPYDILLSDS